MIGPNQSKDLGNGVCPRDALGITYPIWRLGALVSLLYSIGKVMMVKTPDRSLSLKQPGFMHRRENVSPTLRLNRPQRSTTKQGKAHQAFQNKQKLTTKV